MKLFEGLLKRSIKIPVQCSRKRKVCEICEKAFITWKHAPGSSIQFAINLTAQKWLDVFLFLLQSPKVITEQDFHLIKLQTTRESQTKVNAQLCSLKWEPQLRSGDSEQINQNLYQDLCSELLPGGSGLSCFTQQAKGGFSALEIWIPLCQILQMLWEFCP